MESALEAPMICSWPFNQRIVQITRHLSSGLFWSTLPQLLLFLAVYLHCFFLDQNLPKIALGTFLSFPFLQSCIYKWTIRTESGQWITVNANKSEAKARLKPTPSICLTLEWISGHTRSNTHKCHILKSPCFIQFPLKWGVTGGLAAVLKYCRGLG